MTEPRAHLGRGSEARGPAEKNPGKANRIVARSVDFRRLTRSRRGRGFGRSARRLGALRYPYRSHRRSARRLGVCVLRTRPWHVHSSPQSALRSPPMSTERQRRKLRAPARDASAPPVVPAEPLQPCWRNIFWRAPCCASAASSTAGRSWVRAAASAVAARLVDSTRCSPGLCRRPG